MSERYEELLLLLLLLFLLLLLLLLFSRVGDGLEVDEAFGLSPCPCAVASPCSCAGEGYE